jgi:hypothetical protein
MAVRFMLCFPSHSSPRTALHREHRNRAPRSIVDARGSGYDHVRSAPVGRGSGGIRRTDRRVARDGSARAAGPTLARGARSDHCVILVIERDPRGIPPESPQRRMRRENRSGAVTAKTHPGVEHPCNRFRDGSGCDLRRKPVLGNGWLPEPTAEPSSASTMPLNRAEKAAGELAGPAANLARDRERIWPGVCAAKNPAGSVATACERQYVVGVLRPRYKLVPPS